MKSRLLLFASAALALAACGQNDENSVTTNAASNENAVLGSETNTTAPAAAPLTAQGFANAAAASDKFEIESSKLAASAATSAAVKKFALQMINAHTQSTAKLKSTLSGMSPAITPDDTLAPDQQAKLDSLKALKGADFDSAYSGAQVEAHQKALDALKSYAASGDNPKLKEFASGLVPTVTAHLNMAKGLK
jgi:putative membrane protein